METGSFTEAVADTAEATGGEDAQRRSIEAVDALLDEVEQALARLDDGSYGRCEQCGEPIAEERLIELAIVRTCAPCAAMGTPEPVPTPSPGSVSVSEPAALLAVDSADDTVDSADDTIDFGADDTIDFGADDTIDD